ncbi:MAG: lysophospholipid acyltransferase family protein [Verrucomicrobia bacterium]|nr:lysophospholipid acyltransferase family protein [Verrucomicrobiota bacterium]
MSSSSPSSTPTRKRSTGVVVPNPPSRGQRALGWLVANGMRLLTATLRYRVNGGRGQVRLPDEPVIFALWHNRLGLCMKVYERFVRPDHPHDHLAALISASKDGALLASILQRFGVQPVRGSSSRRGAQALLELASWAERGFDLAVTPDGPRGPRYVVQEGVMVLAQVTGLPIVPYSCQLGWKVRAKSWDSFEIPLPFSRCQMTFGEPIYVPRGATDAERGQLREQLQDVLLAGTRGAVQ